MKKRITILLISTVLLSIFSCKKDDPAPTDVPVTGVELDATELELEVGGTAVLTATVLPEDATDKTVTWTSSAPGIASVDENGTISGLSAGNAVVTVTTTDGGKTAECSVTVIPAINGHEYVDLGLSAKWATCNMGAENPWDYGDYYAWGEIVPKEEFTEENSLTYGIDIPDISGDPEYDAARADWGGTWRIPDETEMNELIEECDWEWTTDHDINGFRITGPNGNSIFLPAAGYMNGTLLDYAGDNGLYWGSTPFKSNPIYSYGLGFLSSYQGYGIDHRYYGYSIRPVTE